MSQHKNPTIGFRASSELEQRIKEIATREDRPVSQIVKRCVECGIGQVEKGYANAHAKAE